MLPRYLLFPFSDTVILEPPSIINKCVHLQDALGCAIKIDFALYFFLLSLAV